MAANRNILLHWHRHPLPATIERLLAAAPGLVLSLSPAAGDPHPPTVATPPDGDPLVSTKTLGFGLGLTVCRQLARIHGGEVLAENLAGGGARFCVRLPWGAAGRPVN